MTLVSVAQMNSQNEIEQNFTVIESLIQQSKAQGAELIVFPENFVCFAAGKQRETAAQFEAIQQRLEQLAQQYQIWIVAGTLPCPYRPDGSVIEDGRVRTVSLCISPERTEARYDKIHLFDVQVGDAVGGYQESRFFEPGDELVVAQTPFGNFGIKVRYERLLLLFTLIRNTIGSYCFNVSSAVPSTTRQINWQLLLQARGMDTY